MIDFNCNKKLLKNDIFKTDFPQKNARSFASKRANIVVYNEHIYVRTELEELTRKLQFFFYDIHPEWAFDFQYIDILKKILSEYSLNIKNIAQFFIPKKNTLLSIKENENFKFFYPEEIKKFKKDKRIKMSFGYSKNSPDTLGLGYFYKDKLVAICGASTDGLYTWDIGIEILEPKYREKGIATNLIKNLTTKIQVSHPDIIPVYATCLSHTKSLNLAINSGYNIGWTEISID